MCVRACVCATGLLGTDERFKRKAVYPGAPEMCASAAIFSLICQIEVVQLCCVGVQVSGSVVGSKRPNAAIRPRRNVVRELLPRATLYSLCTIQMSSFLVVIVSFLCELKDVSSSC